MMHFCFIKHVLLSPAKCFFLHLEVKKLCAIEKMNDQALIIFHYHIHDMCLWQIDVHACIFQGHNTILFNIIWNDYYSGINEVFLQIQFYQLLARLQCHSVYLIQ